MNRKGNVTFILLCLVIVMLWFTWALSKRMTSHTQLLTLSDYTQISRYFLESYVGELTQHIRQKSNNPESKIYKQLREDANDGVELDLDGYNISSHLKKMAESYGSNEFKIEPVFPPQVTLIEPKAFDEKCIIVAPDGQKERYGTLKIVCEAKFKEKKYTLDAEIKYTVVYALTPVLRDFILFCSDIKKDQPNLNEICQGDNINSFKTENGKYTDLKPMVLLPPLASDTMSDYVKQAGAVYLGPTQSDSNIFINLVGEGDPNDSNSGNAGELLSVINAEDIQIPASALKASAGTNAASTSFELGPMLGKEMPIVYLQTKTENSVHKVKMGIMGFSEQTKKYFDDNPNYSMEDFLEDKSSGSSSGGNFWNKLKNNRDYISKASGLNLHGVGGNTEREIYGNVYARFFVFTFWEHANTMTPDTPISFNMNKTIDQIPQAKRSTGDFVSFPLPDNSPLKYHHIMSKIVSDYTGNSSDFNNNTNKEHNVRMLMNKNNGDSPLTYKEFKDLDGLKVKTSNCTFDNFTEKWFSDDELALRTGRIFENESEFKKEVGLEDTEKSFQINGIVRVKGNLNLGDSLDDIRNSRIGGGVVVVEGKITLGNISRGQQNIYKNGIFTVEDDSVAVASYKKWITGPDEDDKITPNKIITFVSLSNESSAIKVNADTLLGVHLICARGQSNLQTQIEWEPKKQKEFVFLGGIACKHLNIAESLKPFKNNVDSSKRCKVVDAPFFMYHSGMATSTPPLVVQIPQNMKSYKLTSSAEN